MVTKITIGPISQLVNKRMLRKGVKSMLKLYVCFLQVKYFDS